MLDRILRVVKLDKSVYAEVEADEMATSQAAIVVTIVAIASAIGSGLGRVVAGEGRGFIVAFLVAILSAFIGWLVWSAVTYFVGTSLFKGEATMGEMLRVIGFAQAPQVLGLLSFIPCLGLILSLAGWLLSLYTGFFGDSRGSGPGYRQDPRHGCDRLGGGFRRQPRHWDDFRHRYGRGGCVGWYAPRLMLIARFLRPAQICAGRFL
ncbi:MAG: YIP1 family protein [Anaerolineae bacterium]|nr:YIP1 family protein [Anaerolineae bacterium]